MKYIYIDYETFSTRNIKTQGAHVYVSDPKFRPLILAYAIDKKPVTTFVFQPEIPFALPTEVLKAFLNPDVSIVHHAPFDRLVTNKIMRKLGCPIIPVSRSIDTSILARAAGLPATLGGAANAMGLKTRKNPIGKKAIKEFCIPHGDKQKRPEDNPELWGEFVDYARDDTVICRILHQKLPPLSPSERQLYELDQKINDRGIRIDLNAVKILQRLTKHINSDLNKEMRSVTGGAVDGVTKAGQLAEYLGVPSVAEKPLEALIPTLEGHRKRAAELRMAGAKSSTRKLPAMAATAHPYDQRSRGCLQFCGTRTLRWAGRAWQPQNLPREAFAAHEVDDLIVKANSLSYDDFKQHYPDPLKSVSMCMRGLVVPDIGKVLIMADYSQIEARLVAWYAGQWDALEVYESGGDIYKEMASAVFSKPPEQITKAQRHIGKCLVLGSGYGLGWLGLQRNLAKMGTVATDEEAQLYTKTFREKWHGIPRFWWAIKEALFTVFDNGGVLYHSRTGKYGGQERTGMKFGKEGSSIYIELATGLRCWFHGVVKAREPTPWDKTQMHTVLKARNYNFDGGYSEYTITHMIMAENICSMTARELMAAGMKRLNHEGYEIIMTVHDEIVMETDEFSREWNEEETTLEEVELLMCKRPDWGQDIPLAVEATVDYRYGK